jgi:hypothetical protein
MDLLDKYLERISLLNKSKCIFTLYLTSSVVNNDSEQGKFNHKFVQTSLDKYNLANKCKIITVPNIGYDIGPFVHVINSIDLDSYDLVLKIHTKNEIGTNVTNLNGVNYTDRDWTELLIDSVLKNKNIISKIFSIFKKNLDINMVSSRYCTTSDEFYYEKHINKVNEILSDISLPTVESIEFCAGTIFWARTSIFKLIQNKYTIESFVDNRNNRSDIDCTLAHTFERLFGVLAKTNNGKIKTVGFRNNKKVFIKKMKNYSRFFYENRETEKKQTIKILRINIYKRLK